MNTEASKNRWPYTEESAGSFLSKRWGFVLAALTFAAWCAVITYRAFDLPQYYSEPIVGNIAWTLSNKFHDYAALFSLIGGFLAFFVLVSLFAVRLTKQVGFGAEARLHDFLVLLSAPVGVWLASLLTTKSVSLWLLGLAGLLLVVALFFGFLALLRPKGFWNDDSAQFFRILEKAVLALFVVGFAVASVGMLASRLGPLLHLAEVRGPSVYRGAILGLSLGGLVISGLMLVRGTAAALEASLDKLILRCQLVYPFFFLILIPVPWRVHGALQFGYHVSAAGFGFIGLCTATTLVAVVRKSRMMQFGSPQGAFKLVSIPAATGVILFLKVFPVGLPEVIPDDYHFGELMVPWWSWAQQHLIPFWDYSPARGLMNYLPGVVTAWFFDGTAASFRAVAPFLYVVILAVVLPVLSATIGTGPAILALLFAPYINWISEIDIVVTAFVCLLAGGFLHWRPTTWLASSYCAAIAILLYAPGQGALAIISVSPLAVVMLYRAWRDERVRAIKALLIVAVITLLVGVATPAGKMLFGAVRYGAEQSGINSIAHGISWNASFGKADANPWLFEIARSSWLIVAMLAGSLIFKEFTLKSAESRGRVFAYALPIFALTVLFVIRAAGRIDESAATRLGFASIWALALLLPILIFVVMRPRKEGVAIFLWASAAGLIFPYFGGVANNYSWAFEPVSDPSTVAGYVDGRAVGLPEAGAGVMEPGHLNRLLKTRRVLDALLDPQETYLDLTGRHATYFYFNRRPPIETGSVYNLVAEKQQVRAIASLRRQSPPVVLISADNILHDGGPASLRANLLYRFILLDLGYKVVKTDNLVWLVRSDRVERLPKDMETSVSSLNDDATNPVHDVFRVPNMGNIPASWGRSAASLEARMQKVRSLPDSASPVLASVAREASGVYRVTGDDPHITFDISAWKLAGRDAGILAFDFECEAAGSAPVLEIYWATDVNAESELTVTRFDGKDGRLLVPMDAAPAWLLARELRRIRFDVRASDSCRMFRIGNIAFLQRHGAEEQSRR